MIDVRRRLQSAEEPFGRDIEPDGQMKAGYLELHRARNESVGGNPWPVVKGL